MTRSFACDIGDCFTCNGKHWTRTGKRKPCECNCHNKETETL